MNYKEFNENNILISEFWRNEEGFLHREDGPSGIIYNEDGSVYFENFSLYGKTHRIDGAAVIYYCDGKISSEYFYIHGNSLGCGQKGFWILWKNLSEEQRKNPNLLRTMTRYA